MHTDHLPVPSCLLRIREVLRLCGLSRTTLYREIKLHNFLPRSNCRRGR